MKNILNLEGIHQIQTKEELQYRLEELAKLLICHPDIIYGKVTDLLKEVNAMDDKFK